MEQRYQQIENLVLRGYGINRICDELNGLRPLEFYDLFSVNNKYKAGLPIARKTKPEIDKLIEQHRPLTEISNGRDIKRTLDYIIYSGQYYFWRRTAPKAEYLSKTRKSTTAGHVAKIGDEEQRKILEMIDEKFSLPEMAANVHVTKQAIWDFLKRKGLHGKWLAKRTGRV